MLADFLNPPYPAWGVEELLRILQPSSLPHIEMDERRSVLISSNLIFSKWDQIFKDPMATRAPSTG